MAVSHVTVSEETRRKLLTFQRTEITEHHIYLKLAKATKSTENRHVLERIANEELEHYHFWRAYTGQHVKPNQWLVWVYYLISRLLGFTFGLKLMERGEEDAQDHYGLLKQVIPQIDILIRAEVEHENTVLGLLDEESLRYTGSIVLGLNDALVELTGALAGLTLALQDTRLIALTGSITGIAAALSMATSEYLSTKSEGETKNPLKAAIYTGIAYIATVVVLILPYLVLSNVFLALVCTLAAALVIIASFNYYIAVAKDLSFRARFIEMAGLSLSVAVISFLVGYVLRAVLGVEVD